MRNEEEIWEGFMNDHRYARMKSVQQVDAEGHIYSVFKIDRERYHGARSAIKLLLKKQQVQTTFPQKPCPFGLCVKVFALDDMPNVLAHFCTNLRVCGSLDDKEEPTEKDDCICK